MSTRQEERERRSKAASLLQVSPDAKGLFALFRSLPGLEPYVRGVMDELLVKTQPDVTLSRGERELLAMAVAASNGCFYCMDSHGACATLMLKKERGENAPDLEPVQSGDFDGLGPRMQALLRIALLVADVPRQVERQHIDTALGEGATEQDVRLAVAISSAVSMLTRMVEGVRAPTVDNVESYGPRAALIAEHGYRAVPTMTVIRKR